MSHLRMSLTLKKPASVMVSAVLTGFTVLSRRSASPFLKMQLIHKRSKGAATPKTGCQKVPNRIVSHTFYN